MRGAFSLVCLLAGLAPMRAQSDVAALIADLAAWQSREVGDGVLLRQRRFPALFAGPQSLSVLDIRLGPKTRFDLCAPGRRTRTSVMGQHGEALAAINGGFFAIETTGLSVGLLRLDGELVVPAKDGQASVGLCTEGRLHLAKRPAGDWPAMVDALGAGPMLLAAGKVIDHGDRQRQLRHPRSAIGVTADARVLWLAVDGRAEPAVGMTFEQTATVLQALGCVDALNLDGGGSTTMWVAGLGVCNHPCDNKRFDHDGERAVANALLLRAPAVVVVDDSDAELRGGGWVQRTDGAAWHGHGFASTAEVDARAVFRTLLPRAGRWRVLLSQPEPGVGAAVSVQVYGQAAPVQVGRESDRWAAVGEFAFAAGLPAAIVLAPLTRGLVVDAVRFVQVVE